VALLVLWGSTNPARAAGGLPTGLQDALVVSGLLNPTAMEFAPDGRLFVTQQGGQLRVIKNDVLLSTPFLMLTVDSSGERGLLGVTFDPDFINNQFVYVFYTAPTPVAHNRISRFKANGDVVDTTVAEVVLLDFDNLSSATNHNGGAIHFGLDGKLYAAHGDNATGSNAQTLGNLFGKIIRMNPVPDPTAQIPTDNPFLSTATGKNRLIWALGLRNPFTFSIQPGSGLTYVNDVGQSTWEEINDARMGRNFGWPTTEGAFNASTFPQFTNPSFAYGHGSVAPAGCAITGGAFYSLSTPTFPFVFQGKYFFADYCSGWIYYIDPASPASATPFAASISAPVDLKVGSDGSLYYLARGSGSVGRISPSNTGAPQIVTHPVNQTVLLGRTTTFTVSATGALPLTYQWQRNGVDMPGETAPSFMTLPALQGDNNSTYRCRVSNSLGTVISNAATLTVQTNLPPAVTILTPAVGSRYSGGTTIAFSGSAFDPQEGNVPASRLTWRIDFHHDTHTHPAMPDTTGVFSGTFVVPTTGETSANVWYRVYLTARDSTGLAATSYVDVLPNTVTLTLTTLPDGLQVTLDGQPMTTPTTVASVVGIVRTLGVNPPLGYTFVSWSDGGAATHTIATPATSSSYTATYLEPPAPIAPRNPRIVVP
jgi:glucose/arabinose dehydrogenase